MILIVLPLSLGPTCSHCEPRPKSERVWRSNITLCLFEAQVQWLQKSQWNYQLLSVLCCNFHMILRLILSFVFFPCVTEMVHNLMTTILVASTVIQKPRSVWRSTVIRQLKINPFKHKLARCRMSPKVLKFSVPLLLAQCGLTMQG